MKTAFVETSCKKHQDMNTINLTKADFLKKIVDYETDPTKWEYLGDKPAIINFYATWCTPSKIMAPILEELAEEYENDIYIYKIDVDAEQELSAAFNIRNTPTLVFIPINDSPQVMQGITKKQMLKKALEDILLRG